ncbi:hypothetical protein ACJJTC_007287 [Scirpophaga incertulas]
MKPLFFIMLIGYTVKCDDSSYYVVEIPEEPARSHKPFKVYWNVPTMQCRSKKIPFTKLFEKYGIIQNANDSFRGENIAILYDPGLFPALFKSENGSFKFRNGGVPQEGDLEKHLEAFRDTMEQSIPDPTFNGVGIIDFESWRPVFRQNFGVLTPYKDISYQIERRNHWFWPEKAIQSSARQRFEESARGFMQATLSLARRMRPRALWGYYAFPYCFNMSPNNMLESCAYGVPKENDNISWLWSGSTALYPSVYTAPNSRLASLAALVRGRVHEAARLRPKGVPILPYFWYRHRDGSYLSQDELNTVFSTVYNSDASGFIIWGSSNDVNTVEKCKKLHKFTEELLGPTVSKYTKGSDNFDIGTTILRSSTEQKNNKSTESDENTNNYLEKPNNYTQDILNLVESNRNKRNDSKYSTEQEYIDLQKKTFLEMLFNMLTNERETENEYLLNSENEKNKTNKPITSTDSSNINDIASEFYSVNTENTNIYKYSSTEESSTSEMSTTVQQKSLSTITTYPLNNTNNILKSMENIHNNSNYYFIFNSNIIDDSLNNSTASQVTNVTENYTQTDILNTLYNESSPSYPISSEYSQLENTIKPDNQLYLTSTDILVTNTETTHTINDASEFSLTDDIYYLESTTRFDEYLYENSNEGHGRISTRPDIETTTELPSETLDNLLENNIDENFYNDIMSLAINITEIFSIGFTNIQDGDKMLRIDEVETNVNIDNTTDATEESDLRDELSKDYEGNPAADETTTNSVRLVALN